VANGQSANLGFRPIGQGPPKRGRLGSLTAREDPRVPICAALLALPALPRAGQTVTRFHADLRRNLACTAASYAALDADATKADYASAEEYCATD
jgi:hypothetical protein